MTATLEAADGMAMLGTRVGALPVERLQARVARVNESSAIKGGSKCRRFIRVYYQCKGGFCQQRPPYGWGTLSPRD